MTLSIETLVNNHDFAEPARQEDVVALKRRLYIATDNVLARVAIGRALGEPKGADATFERWLAHLQSAEGRQIRSRPISGKQLFGDQIVLWTTLLLTAERPTMPKHVADAVVREPEGPAPQGEGLVGGGLHLAPELSVDQKTASQAFLAWFDTVVRRYWAHGVTLLLADAVRADAAGLPLAQVLSDIAIASGSATNKSGGQDGTAPVRPGGFVTGGLKLRLGDPGTKHPGNEPLYWTMNETGHSPHVVITGAPGKGKTRTARAIWKQIHENAQLPLLIIDPKGDLGDDLDFAKSIGATVIRVQKDPVPLDVLVATDDPADTAMRFSESFAKAMNNVRGDIQKDRLRVVLKELLLNGKPLTLQEVRDAVAQFYTSEGLKDDSVAVGLRKLTEWELFRPQMSPDQFFSRTWILSLNKANSEVQLLVVGLLVDALYGWVRQLTDTQIVNGVQGMRGVFAIDEAHQLLGKKQESLDRLLRECRSKGIAAMMMSQRPADFDGYGFDNIALEMVFCLGEPMRAEDRARWNNVSDAHNLGKGLAYARTPGGATVKVKAW